MKKYYIQNKKKFMFLYIIFKIKSSDSLCQQAMKVA